MHWLFILSKRGSPGTQEGAIHLLDMDNGYAEVLGWQAHDENDRVLDIVFSADGKTLASSGAGGTIRLWSVETLPSSPDRIITIPNQDECWPPSECWVRALDISRDHRFLAAGAQNRRLYLWDLSATADAAPLINERLPGNVRAVAFNHDNTWLAAGDESGWIVLYHLPQRTNGEAGSLQPSHRLKLPQLPNVYALAFHPTQDLLAIASHAGPVLTLPVGETIGSPVTLGIIDAGLDSVAYSPSGAFLATGSADGSIRLWNSEPINGEPATLQGHTGTVRAVAFRPAATSSPNATPYSLLSAGEDESVRLWTPGESSAETQQLFESGNEILAAAVSSDGRWIATGGRDGSVRLRAGEDIEAEPMLLGAHAGEIVAIAFSPDSAFLASGAADRRILLWDLESRSAAPQVLENREAGILALAYSNDGTLLASGDEAGQVKLWELTQSPPTGRLLFRHDNWVRSLAFSPNGAVLASASDDGTIRLSALVEGVTDQGPVPAHEPRACAVAFAPSGALLASAGDDGSVDLWNPLNLQEEPVALRQHVGVVRTLAFSADGKFLASAGDDTVIRIWTVSLDDLRQMACERVARNFSEAEWQRYFGTERLRQSCPTVGS